MVDLIEFDGDAHGEYHKLQEDEISDKYLECFGFTVLCSGNKILFHETEYFKSEIRKVFNKK
ncbi:MAG: hypothetical protein A2X05_13010 [Bacteroidetes bacterium GWE2_41_25]|nr:MAG: hypothetical protein A2X03_08915 [Bacteroidetes bacterium GWA2_40_15]OFX87041.1 MAG: hypothetical protein A2X06_03180 [Bacteroidetes bacterium GWC2_40_22]OFY10025.1 MAG: hypothetical protein A2X05_13010 [Bacteroidetes bacterium GWE2_41_25]OFY59349.1 MAG: hypothetical protein A2X04_15810 [Bacteroidetes bacterium GWF2_41_9]